MHAQAASNASMDRSKCHCPAGQCMYHYCRPVNWPSCQAGKLHHHWPAGTCQEANCVCMHSSLPLRSRAHHFLEHRLTSPATLPSSLAASFERAPAPHAKMSQPAPQQDAEASALLHEATSQQDASEAPRSCRCVCGVDVLVAAACTQTRTHLGVACCPCSSCCEQQGLLRHQKPSPPTHRAAAGSEPGVACCGTTACCARPSQRSCSASAVCW